MSFTPELLERVLFNENDKLALQKAIKARWKAKYKRLRITFLLPLLIAIVLSSIFYMLEYRFEIFNLKEEPITQTPPDPWVPLLFVFPAMFLVSLANIVLFIKTIPSIYIDKWKGLKERILFKPEPYMIPDPIQTEEMNKYYIKTNVYEFPFFEVDFNSYIASMAVEYLVLEITPITRILLSIRTKDNENILTF